MLKKCTFLRYGFPKVLLKMLTFLQSPLISVKCWVVICDQHLHLVSPAQCDCQVYNFRNLRLISQVHHSAGANLYTCANSRAHCALADLHQMSPVSGTYIQVQIVRYNCAVADVSIDDMFVEDEAGDGNSGR